MNVNSIITMRYANMDNWLFGKTNPNKPKITNNQLSLIDNHLEGKPNSRKVKMNAFAWIIYAIGTCAIGRNFTIVFCDFLAEFTILKGANSKLLLRAKPLQTQSAKMAQKLMLPNPKNNTHKKYNFLSINMLSSLGQYNPPTGTSFAYLRPEKMKLLRKEYNNG